MSLLVLLTDFKHCSGVSSADFEPVNIDWVPPLLQNYSQLLNHLVFIYTQDEAQTITIQLLEQTNSKQMFD